MVDEASPMAFPNGFVMGDVLEYSSDAILLLGPDWRYTYVNHAAELLLRRKRGDLLGQGHWALYPELLGTPADAQLRTVALQRRPASFEQYFPGLYAWHSVLAVPSGEGIILFCRDITDRMRALREDAVREGIRNLLEDVPVAIMLTRGPQHRIDLQNAFSRQLLGGRNAEGMTVENAVPEARPQGFIEILDRVYASAEAFIGKDMAMLYDRDGTGMRHQGHIDLTCQPVFDTTGTVSGILHMGVDVSERLRERAMLQRFAAERDATLRQLSEGVIITDAGGRINFVNDAARRLHGMAALDVEVEAYSTTYSLFTEEGQPYPFEQLPLARAVLRDEFVDTTRWRIRRPDGSEVLVEGSAQPVFGEDRRKIACVLTLREAGNAT